MAIFPTSGKRSDFAKKIMGGQMDGQMDGHFEVKKGSIEPPLLPKKTPKSAQICGLHPPYYHVFLLLSVCNTYIIRELPYFIAKEISKNCGELKLLYICVSKLSMQRCIIKTLTPLVS